MANRTAGAILKLSIDGISFDVMSDSEIESVGSAYENDAIPTSGVAIRVMKKRVETREGIVIAADPEEQEQLKSLSEKRTTSKLSYTTAGGSTYRTVGWIEFENHNTMENKAAVKMFPEKKNGWEVFVA